MEELPAFLAKLPLDGWTCQAEQMVADYPDLLELACEAHLDKFFHRFRVGEPRQPQGIGRQGRVDVARSREVTRKIHDHGIGVSACSSSAR
jgi:hypothetical protein